MIIDKKTQELLVIIIRKANEPKEISSEEIEALFDNRSRIGYEFTTISGGVIEFIERLKRDHDRSKTFEEIARQEERKGLDELQSHDIIGHLLRIAAVRKTDGVTPEQERTEELLLEILAERNF